MNKKKHYVWQLASFLHSFSMTMSGEELVGHLNRNNFLTSSGLEYQGGRGIYTLIRETWKWVQNDLGLPNEAQKIAETFVESDGSFAYEK